MQVIFFDKSDKKIKFYIADTKISCTVKNDNMFLFSSLFSKSDGSVSILLIDLAVDVIHQVSVWAKL